ncbi:MAG: hypothetical protein HQL06_11760 [Nitrospirae bacterium]|nr:hypothetical protein [Nitrospirota bacterium]
MINAVAQVMPVGMTMKVETSSSGYETQGGGLKQWGSSSVAVDAERSTKGRDVDSIVDQVGVVSGNNDKSHVEDVKGYISKEGDVKGAGDKQQNKAYFEIDDDDKIVIKVVDAEGKLLKQIPPDDYKKSVRRLEEVYKKVFHKEV